MTQARSLFNQFREIRGISQSEDRYVVVSLPDLKHKIGVSPEGHPKFFVCTNNSPATVQNVIRELLSVEYSVPCQLKDNDGNLHSGYYTIITLRSLDEALQGYFMEVFSMMLDKLPAEPSKRELSIDIENLIAIFSALVAPPKKKLQGLWAELLVIEQSSHPEVLISAWHSSPSAKYDFTSGRDKIEVKSTSSEDRVHRFALDQLNPSANSRLLIASTIVRESGPACDGLSVKGLYEKICTRISAINSKLRLYMVIAETIGTDIDKFENMYFDYTSAVDSLEFYDYHDVPSINKDAVSNLVTEVKFCSNLEGLIDVRKPESNFDIDSSELFKSIR